MSKNIVILVDGTWQSADSNYKTNIYKLQSMLPDNDQQQVCYYQDGIGSKGILRKVWKGLIGSGINQQIVNAYAFLVEQYQPGDKIFLFGFSRGAYSVRSLAGMIYNIGILQTSDTKQMVKGFELYRSDGHPDTDQTAIAFRKAFSYPRDQIDIQFLGVYDTVGELGIPLKLFKSLNYSKYNFHDTKLNKLIKVARHALAIDEHRNDFKPTFWQTHAETNSQQRWFVGAHSDVGGGYKEAGLSDIALQWMLSEALNCGLRLAVKDSDIFLNIRPNPLGPIHDSRFKGKRLEVSVRSSHNRVMGRYKDEVLDPSVLQRMRAMDYQPEHLVAYLGTVDEYSEVLL
jgi:uncharacterized protein (DUF2235 family)